MHDATLTGAGLARHVVGYIFGHEPRPSSGGPRTVAGFVFVAVYGPCFSVQPCCGIVPSLDGPGCFHLASASRTAHRAPPSVAVPSLCLSRMPYRGRGSSASGRSRLHPVVSEFLGFPSLASKRSNKKPPKKTIGH